MSLSVICHNVANMYAEPDDRSECVSQVVFNERVLGIKEEKGFAQTESADRYIGWVRDEHILHGANGEPHNEKVTALFAPVYNKPNQCEVIITRLVMGTKVWTLKADCEEWRQVELIWNDMTRRKGFVPAELLSPYHLLETNRLNTQQMMNKAGQLLGIPYLWGGTTPFGFDCSGLTQRLYGLWDIILPRDAYLQYESPLGDKLGEDEPCQAGDLVFWVGKSDPRNRGITHVGIMTDEKQVIHAYSKMGVVVTPLVEMTSKLGYTYRGAWRYRNEATNE